MKFIILLFRCKGYSHKKVLIPKKQLKNVKIDKPLKSGYDSSICPYCILYAENDECLDCPMDAADNSCILSPNSSYMEVINEVHKLGYSSIADIPEIKKLVREFNDNFLK